jgi:hypothetical protein
MQIIDLTQGQGVREGLKTLADALTPDPDKVRRAAYYQQEAQKVGAETLKLQRENEARARIQARLAAKGAWENPDVIRENTADWSLLGDPRALQAAASGRAFESVAERQGNPLPTGFGPSPTAAPAPDTRYLGTFGGGSSHQAPAPTAPVMGAGWDQPPQTKKPAPAPIKLDFSGMAPRTFDSAAALNQYASNLRPDSPHYQDILAVNAQVNPPLRANPKTPFGPPASGQGVLPPAPFGGWQGNPNYNNDDEYRLFAAGIHAWPQTRTGQLEGVYGDLARTSIQQDHEDARNRYRVDNGSLGTPKNWIDPESGVAGGVTLDGLTDARTGQPLPDGATLGGTQSPVPRGDLLTSSNRSMVQRQQLSARDVVASADKLREQLHKTSTVVGLTGNVLRVAGGAVGQAKALLETAASQDPYGLADPSAVMAALQGAHGALSGASVDAAQFSSDIISLAYTIARERNGTSQISNRDVALTLSSLGDNWYSSPDQAMARLDDISRGYREREAAHAARLRGDALQPLPPMQTYQPGSSALPQGQGQGQAPGQPHPVPELGVEALDGLDTRGLVDLLSAVNSGRARLSPQADVALTRRIRNIQTNGGR